MFDPTAPDPTEVDTKNVMKDKTVMYHNTEKLSKKTQQIYANLPPIVDSININKVSKSRPKVPNKVLTKRLARMQLGGVVGEADAEYDD